MRCGIYPLSHFEFAYDNALAYKTYFTQEMLKLGFLASTGFYVSFAHKEETVDKYLEAYNTVLEKISKIIKSNENIENHLEAGICRSGFERLN